MKKALKTMSDAKNKKVVDKARQTCYSIIAVARNDNK